MTVVLDWGAAVFLFLSRKNGRHPSNFEPINHLFTQNFYCNEKNL